MAAKKVILIANGSHKADIVSQTVHGTITNQIPASILQQHPNCYIVVDQADGVLGYV
jgi:glucosamine-6-phosphate deaminase